MVRARAPPGKRRSCEARGRLPHAAARDYQKSQAPPARAESAVNFLLHHHFAALELGSEASGIGAMLPDLWRMADRRARTGPRQDPGIAAGAGAEGPLAELLAGIEHHLEIDRWFHTSPELALRERACAERLRSSGATAPRLSLFAHIVWEMALDGALVRAAGLAGILDRIRRGFALTAEARRGAIRARGIVRVFASGDEIALFDQRMERLTSEIARGPWIESYQSGPGLAACLAGVRSRIGMPPLTGDDREKLAEALDPIATAAAGALEALLASREEALARAASSPRGSL